MAEPSFTTVDTEFSVDLHPSALRNVSTSVKQVLQELVLTYRPEYSGVVMGYQNVRIMSSAAPVHTFFPYTHVKVSAKLLILDMRKNQIMGVPSGDLCVICCCFSAHKPLSNGRRAARHKYAMKGGFECGDKSYNFK